MAGVMLAVAIAVGTANAWLAGWRAHRQVEARLRELGHTLAEASFPLTDNVLRQMRGLSGAEFVVTDRDGGVAAASLAGLAERAVARLLRDLPAGDHPNGVAWQRVRIDDTPYLHWQLDLVRPFRGGTPGLLHVLYPESRYRQAWRDAVWPPAVAGLAALVVVVGISGWVAHRVTKPLYRLAEQADRIAHGEFAPLPIPARDDELRDLSLAFNQMACTLTRYEQQVRRHEKLRTLGRLGGGIAHQLRNAVTGCRLAIELHARQCRLSDQDELDVARRQLDVMEEYIGRFLALGQRREQPRVRVDLADLIEGSLGLVRPKASHLGVELQSSVPTGPFRIDADADALTQAVVNLLLNAVEAAAEAAAWQVARGGPESSARQDIPNHSPVTRPSPRVIVQTSEVSDQTDGNRRVRLEILDNGAGPADPVRDHLFEPLVSEKPDGAGLGLSLAHETIARHGGALNWRRREGWTCFSIELSIAEEDAHVESAGGR